MNFPLINAKVIKRKKNKVVFSDTINKFSVRIPG